MIKLIILLIQECKCFIYVLYLYYNILTMHYMYTYYNDYIYITYYLTIIYFHIINCIFFIILTNNILRVNYIIQYFLT